MTNYELVGETIGVKAQNEAWFANNLQVHLKPKHCHFNISMDNNSNVEITFDGGSNWADFSTGKKLEVADEYHLVLKPSDSFNLRATGGSGTTVEHCAIYAEV